MQTCYVSHIISQNTKYDFCLPNVSQIPHLVSHTLRVYRTQIDLVSSMNRIRLLYAQNMSATLCSSHVDVYHTGIWSRSLLLCTELPVSSVSLAVSCCSGSVLLCPQQRPCLHSRFFLLCRRHLSALKEMGVVVVPPVSKILACGDNGKSAGLKPFFPCYFIGVWPIFPKVS